MPTVVTYLVLPDDHPEGRFALRCQLSDDPLDDVHVRRGGSVEELLEVAEGDYQRLLQRKGWEDGVDCVARTLDLTRSPGGA